MNISKIKPTSDNILLQFDAAIDPHIDRQTPGGLFIPRTALDPKVGTAVEAIVVALGPGRYADSWLDHERGTSEVGSSKFIPMSMLLPDVRPGSRVLCNAQALAADRVYSDERLEYRMCRASVIEAVIT